MTQTTEFSLRIAKEPKSFQEFVFVADSAMKRLPSSTARLQLPENNACLNRIEVGSTVTIQQIYTPCDITQQLRSLGLEAGKQVRLLNRADNGSVIVRHNNTSIGIGQEIAREIVVVRGDYK